MVIDNFSVGREKPKKNKKKNIKIVVKEILIISIEYQNIFRKRRLCFYLAALAKWSLQY